MAKDKSKDYRGAIADYNKTLEMEDDNADAHFYRGFNKALLKKFNSAMKDYNQAIKLNPTNPEYYLQRGKLKIQLKKKNGCSDLDKYKELGGDADRIKETCK
jgi:tetratricopeptide (TPR) repeat protein